MRLKKVMVLLLTLTLLLSCYACSEPSGNNVRLENKGRYMEEKISLALPSGVTDQQLIGINAIESGMEYFTMFGSVDGDSYRVGYYRYTMGGDGSVSATPEKWLEEIAPNGGNQMLLVRGADGHLYFNFSDYDESGELQNHIIVSKDDGQTYTELSGSGIQALDMIVALAPLDDGRIAVQDMGGNVLLLNAEGNLARELEMGSDIGGLATHGSRIAMRAQGGKAIRVLDLTSGESMDWEIDLPENNTSKIKFAGDGTLYLANSSGLYSHAPDGTMWELFVDGDTSNLGIPSFHISYLAVMNGENDILYVADYEDGIYRYAYDPEAAQTASIELDVFSLAENDMMRHAVVAFSRQRSDVKVNYTIATELAGSGTNSDYIKALNTELLSGTGPDILLLDGLPLDSYIKKGVLTDINEIVNDAEAILPNIRQAFDMDGTLYAMPLGIRLPVVLTKGDVNSYDSLAALAEAAEAANGPVILSPIGYSYETLCGMLLSNYADTLYTGGDVDAFLSNVKRISDAIGSTETLGEGMDVPFQISEAELREMLLVDQLYPQIYAYVLGQAQSAVFDIGALDETGCMIGATLAEQYGGKLSAIDGQFRAVGLVGINKASKELDTAKEFLRLLLSYEVQSADGYNSSFPVNKKALAALFAKENSNIGTGYVVDEEHEVTGVWPSVSMRQKIMDMIETADHPMVDNAELKDMLLPRILAYLNGSSTLNEASEAVTSILDTYLSE